MPLTGIISKHQVVSVNPSSPVYADRNLVEESNNFARNMLSSSFFMVHYTSRSREHNVSELTRWKQLDDPLLNVTELNIVSGRDNTSLVETTVKLDNDFAASMIIDLLKFTNVTFVKR